MRIDRTGSDLDPVVDQIASRWTSDSVVERIWARDPTVFGPPGVPEIADRMGWLTLPSTSRPIVEPIADLHRSRIEAGVDTVVLCGMGGSSLAPEVFAHLLGQDQTDARLTVVDTTHPDALAAVAADIDVDTTWFVISSKSGTTVETISAFHWLWGLVEDGVDDVGSHFIAVTDPGSILSSEATERGFRAVFHADPTVGGRYSALSHFGLVPAGLIGVDVARLLDNGVRGAARCGPSVELSDNPGFTIGALLAACASDGADKVRFIGDPPYDALGVWAEQLIAESTGKHGKGIVPVVGGDPRIGAPDELVIATGDQTRSDGSVTFGITDPYEIAEAMFILEFAVATVGEVLGINPFDQPDVQHAKDLAKQALAGTLVGSTTPTDITDASVLDAVTELVDGAESYVAIQAYLAPTDAADRAIERLRSRIAARTGLAVTTGYGPRFLHSTGQLHKGGPAGGVFLQLVDSPHRDIPIPGTESTFGELIAGQASGDRKALSDAHRSTLAVGLGADPLPAIDRIASAVESR
ncbi:MAG: glucose-6-phosphate isomerase [Acidimicrobiia bacterium]|nr:glucose-6-phosphate isomerase [Acidimicrobiia bacterium]